MLTYISRLDLTQKDIALICIALIATTVCLSFAFGFASSAVFVHDWLKNRKKKFSVNILKLSSDNSTNIKNIENKNMDDIKSFLQSPDASVFFEKIPGTPRQNDFYHNSTKLSSQDYSKLIIDQTSNKLQAESFVLSPNQSFYFEKSIGTPRPSENANDVSEYNMD